MQEEALNKEQESHDNGTAAAALAATRPAYESYALRCRWGRVDALVGEGGVVDALTGCVAAGVTVLRAEGRLAGTGAGVGGGTGRAPAAREASSSLALQVLQWRDPPAP